MAAQKLKASEKQEICKKVAAVPKRHYPQNPPVNERPALETTLYGICLENADYTSAAASLERLYALFHHDLNEMRVSTVSELEQAFQGQEDSDWKALRVRALLQYVFEQNFDYQIEGIRRKTLDSAATDLGKIPQLSPFIQNYVIQEMLSGHVIPVDRRTRFLALWLGLVEPQETDEEAAASMKQTVRKAEAPQLFHLLHSLANDPAYRATFEEADQEPPEEGYDANTAVDRLRVLFGEIAEKKTTPKKAPAKKTAPKAAEKTTEKNEKKSTGKTAPKKSGSKKAPGKTSTKK